MSIKTTDNMKQSNEIIVTVHNTDELAALDKNTYCFTASRVLKTWKEDFLDEDNGEVVTMDRTEVVFEKGMKLYPNDFSELLFRFQTGDITEAQLSNVQRQGIIKSAGRFRLWIVKADGARKMKLLLRADNAMSAYEVAKDYIELNYRGHFSIEGIKTFTDCIVIEPKEEENQNISVDRYWYMVSTEVLQQDEGEEPVILYTSQFLVFAENVESANVIIDRYIAEEKTRRGDNDTSNIVLRTSSASTISCNVVVPADFCLPYSKELEI